MKKYCINCGKLITNKKPKSKGNNLSTFDNASSDTKHREDFCYSCNTPNDFDSLAKIDSHDFNQLAHNNIIKASDKKDNALCFFVIGIILIVVGGALFGLSFKRNVLNIRVFRPTSLEFALGVFLLVLGGAALIYSIIKLVKVRRARKYFRSVLRDINYRD